MPDPKGIENPKEIEDLEKVIDRKGKSNRKTRNRKNKQNRRTKTTRNNKKRIQNRKNKLNNSYYSIRNTRTVFFKACLSISKSSKRKKVSEKCIRITKILKVVMIKKKWMKKLIHMKKIKI